MISLIYFLLIGLAAGWLASQVMGGNAGLLKLMIVGVIGSFVGGFLIRLLGFSKKGPVAEVLTAALGAIVLVYLIRRFT